MKSAIFILLIMVLSPSIDRVSAEERNRLETKRLIIEWGEGTVTNEIEAAKREGGRFYSALREMLDHEPKSKITILLRGPFEQPDGRRGYPHVDSGGRIHLFRFGPTYRSYFSALAHEMVHVFRRHRRPHADWFFEEGFAEFVALRVDPSLRGFPWYDFPVIVAAGQCEKSGDATLTLDSSFAVGAALVSSGTLVIAGGRTLTTSSGLNVNAGELSLPAANSRVVGILTTIASNARLSGFGMAGATRIEGVLAPGSPASIGTLTFMGDLVLTSSATFEVEFDATTHDMIDVQGSAEATLGGSLQIVLPVGFTPVTTPYTLLTASTVLGSFDSVSTSCLFDFIPTPAVPTTTATELTLSYQPGEGSAEGFYRKCGFEHTGEEDEGELVMRLGL